MEQILQLTRVVLTLFNGSYIGKRNTGIGVVATNLARSFCSDSVRILDPLNTEEKGSIDIPSDLSPENGLQGHIKRLYWLQTCAPSYVRREGAEFLLSPLPEAPLFSSIRSVVLAHDLLPLRYPKPNFLLAYYSFYIPMVLHQAELVLCNSEATARELNTVLKVPISKLVTIKLGFDAKYLYPKPITKKDYFLIVGRHNPHKNLARVLKAFSLFKIKSYKLLIIGPSDPRYTPRLKKIANELGISSKCIWKDWVSEEERLLLLNQCRGLIIASLWEGFGLPALEAMACGTPVIASNRGALPEIVGETALMIDPLNYRSILNAMTETCQNIDFQKSASVNGPIQASGFNWNTTAKQIEQLLLDIC